MLTRMILIDTVYAHSLDSDGVKILLGILSYQADIPTNCYIYIIRDVSDAGLRITDDYSIYISAARLLINPLVGQ